MTTYTKICKTCKIIKPTTDFFKNKRASDGLQSECRECQKEYNKKYYENNKEKLKESQKEYGREYYQTNKDRIKEYRESNKERLADLRKEWREANKEHLTSYMREYMRKRRSSDPLFALADRLRSLIGQSLRKNGYKKTSRTYEILGCSFEEFKIYLESQFTEGMSWDNRDEWHIDHKEPVSWGKTPQRVIELNHYTNLKPMWATDNWSKSNKYAD